MSKLTKQTKESKDLTTTKEFKPTPGMILWLDTAVRLMSQEVTEIADECKMSRQIWYEWLKIPEFPTWYKSEWDRRLAAHSWKLDAVGLRRALGPSSQNPDTFKYWEKMQQRVGNLQDKSSSTTGAFEFKEGDKQLRVVITRGEHG